MKTMYCKNCGNEMDAMAAVCVKCGVSKGTGDKFCPNCGASTPPNAAFCVQCGATLNAQGTTPEGIHYTPEMQKSKLAAGLFGIFLGGLGVHNFYLGFIGKGIAQIILSPCFGIGALWGFIEGILILTGNINRDASGIPLKE